MTKEKHEEHEEAVKEAPKAKAAEAASAPFPFSASINEPQTVSLPIPPHIEVPVPKITSLNPAECALGDDDFVLYVTGENFFKDSLISFAGQDEPTTLNDDGTLSTGVNMAMWQGPDTVPVVIKNGPEVSEPVDFTFHEAGAKRSKTKK